MARITQKASILIVTDAPENISNLASALEPLGQELAPTSPKMEALKAAPARDFAVAVVNLGEMPMTQGLEAARAIRQHKPSALTPIILVVGRDATPEDIGKGYRLGAVDYLWQPFPPEALRWKVSNFVDLYLNTKADKRPRRTGGLAPSGQSPGHRLEDLERKCLPLNPPELEFAPTGLVGSVD